MRVGVRGEQEVPKMEIEWMDELYSGVFRLPVRTTGELLTNNTKSQT